MIPLIRSILELSNSERQKEEEGLLGTVGGGNREASLNGCRVSVGMMKKLWTGTVVMAAKRSECTYCY